MSLLCGSSNCNPLKFLMFQGSTNNGQSPFTITYDLANNTAPLSNNITHMNDTGNHKFYHCNENVTSGYGGVGICSCSDCPSTCPAPPKFTVNHLPFRVIAWGVGATGLFISTIIFIAALSTSVYFGFFRKQTEYQRISGAGSPPPKQTYGATRNDVDDRECSTNSSLNSDRDKEREDENGGGGGVLGCCCQVGHHVERAIKLVFYHWGRFVAQFWYIVLIVTVVIAGTLSFGLFFFSVTTDPVKLWSAPNSRARLEKNYFDENFGPFYRTEQILVKAKPLVKEFNITVPEEVVQWTFGAVYNDSLLHEVSERAIPRVSCSHSHSVHCTSPFCQCFSEL